MLNNKNNSEKQENFSSNSQKDKKPEKQYQEENKKRKRKLIENQLKNNTRNLHNKIQKDYCYSKNGRKQIPNIPKEKNNEGKYLNTDHNTFLAYKEYRMTDIKHEWYKMSSKSTHHKRDQRQK